MVSGRREDTGVTVLGVGAGEQAEKKVTSSGTGRGQFQPPLPLAALL